MAGFDSRSFGSWRTSTVEEPPEGATGEQRGDARREPPTAHQGDETKSACFTEEKDQAAGANFLCFHHSRHVKADCFSSSPL